MTTRIVVLGGGTAGVTAARNLSRSARSLGRRGGVDICVVDATAWHLRRSTLPHLAAAPALRLDVAAAPLAHLVGGVSTLTAAAVGIDPVAKRLVVRRPGERSEREVAYDHLVVALGSVQEDLGIDGVAEHALMLRTPGDALAVRARLVAKLAEAADETDAERRRALATVVIVGGGIGGIGLAGMLAESLPPTAAGYDQELAPQVRVVLCDRKPRLLTGLPEEVGRMAAAALERRGVELRLGAPALAITADGVRLKGGVDLPCATAVWTAGVRAPRVIESEFGAAEQTTGGRLVTTPMLEVRGMDGVWAAGDCASVPNLEGGGDCPALGVYAAAQAKRLARNLLAVLGDDWPQSFRKVPPALLVPVGANEAVGLFRGHPVEGRRGFMTWRASVTSTAATAAGLAGAAGVANARSGALAAAPLERSALVGTPRPGQAVVTLKRKPLG